VDPVVKFPDVAFPEAEESENICCLAPGNGIGGGLGGGGDGGLGGGSGGLGGLGGGSGGGGLGPGGDGLGGGLDTEVHSSEAAYFARIGEYTLLIKKEEPCALITLYG